MIYYSIPYSTEKNIGKYYNDVMKTIPSDQDFSCFVDGDTIFTTPFYGYTIENVIEQNPNISCYTCYTNRVYCPEQIAPGVDTKSNDMAYHRNFGLMMESIYGTSCEDITKTKSGNLMSGCMILIQKRLWKKIGGFLENGMLGVDNDLHTKVIKSNEKLYLMRGVYLYHWYRWPNYKDKSHLL